MYYPSIKIKAFLALFIFLGLLAQSCMNEKTAKSVGPLNLKTLVIEQKSGPDCDKPDTLIQNCAHVKFLYPQLLTGPDSLRQAVDNWAREFMTSWVGMSEEPDNLPPLDEAITNFFNMQQEQVKEMPNAPSYFVAETTDTVLLNDGKYLTLQLDGYSYAGGAHPNASSTVATWDVATCQKVTLDELVTNLDSLQKIAEKKFRLTRADLFKPEQEGGSGFQFDETFPFKLADNTGLVSDGIYFIYVPYEVGPWAMGATEFVVPFADIQGIRK
jgi:hypothetical protein